MSLTTQEAAAALKVNPRTITRWIKSGALKAARLPGGAYRVPESEIGRLQSIEEVG